jgi:hypothetical protein
MIKLRVWGIPIGLQGRTVLWCEGPYGDVAKKWSANVPLQRNDEGSAVFPVAVLKVAAGYSFSFLIFPS